MSFLARCTRVFNHKLKIKLDALKADAPKAAVSRFCEGFKITAREWDTERAGALLGLPLEGVGHC